MLKTWPGAASARACEPGAADGLPGESGGHRLTLTADLAAKVLFEEFVIANDLGFVPEGTVNFRVEP